MSGLKLYRNNDDTERCYLVLTDGVNHVSFSDEIFKGNTFEEFMSEEGDVINAMYGTSTEDELKIDGFTFENATPLKEGDIL